MDSLVKLQNEDEPLLKENESYKSSRAKTFCINDCSRYFKKSKKMACLSEKCNANKFKELINNVLDVTNAERNESNLQVIKTLQKQIILKCLEKIQLLNPEKAGWQCSEDTIIDLEQWNIK